MRRGSGNGCSKFTDSSLTSRRDSGKSKKWPPSKFFIRSGPGSYKNVSLTRLETRHVQQQGNIFTECENDGLEDRAFSASVDLPKEKWPTDKSKWKKLSRNKNIFPVPMKLKRGPKPKFE